MAQHALKNGTRIDVTWHEDEGVTDPTFIEIVRVGTYKEQHFYLAVTPPREVRVYRGVVPIPERVTSFVIFPHGGSDWRTWNRFLKAPKQEHRHLGALLPIVHGSIFRSFWEGGGRGDPEAHRKKCVWVIEQYATWVRRGRPRGVPKGVQDLRSNQTSADGAHAASNGLVLPGDSTWDAAR